jgi:hypothetical protein
VKADLLDHRKFLRLARLLAEPKAHVLGYLMLMWRRGYQTGNPLLGDALDVEAAAEFTGEPGKFATAAHSAGFIDKLPDERYRIHDLWDHAPEWARKRMARNGYLPDGIESYCGIVPKGRRTADKLPEQTPRGGKNDQETGKRSVKVRGQRSEGKGRTKTLPADAGGGSPDTATPEHHSDATARGELFDFIRDLTGSDSKAHGSRIGRVVKHLLAASPPHTLDEVRKLSDPAFQAREMPWLKGRKPNLGEVENIIGRIRNPSSGSASAAKPPAETPLERMQRLQAELDARKGEGHG